MRRRPRNCSLEVRGYGLSRSSLMIIAAAALVVLSVSGCTRDTGEDDWQSRLDVRVEAGEDPDVLKVVLEGRRGWEINRLYPGIRLDVAAREPAEASSLDRDDVRYEEESGHDKARRAVFFLDRSSLDEEGVLRGTYRAVICTDHACSPPFDGEIEVVLPPTVE